MSGRILWPSHCCPMRFGSESSLCCRRTRQAERRPTASFRSCGAHGDSLRIENGLSVGISSAGVGLRMRHDVLATTPRLARGWCLEADMEATFGRIGIGRPNRLVNIRDRQLLRASSFWGAKTGPNPTDRGKNGSKRHLMVDGSGTPLAITHTGANCHDSEMAIPLVNAVPPIKQPRGALRSVPMNCSRIEPMMRKPRFVNPCASGESSRWLLTATPSTAAAWANSATSLKPVSWFSVKWKLRLAC